MKDDATLPGLVSKKEGRRDGKEGEGSEASDS
jgi:hypothetical protein